MSPPNTSYINPGILSVMKGGYGGLGSLNDCLNIRSIPSTRTNMGPPGETPVKRGLPVGGGGGINLRSTRSTRSTRSSSGGPLTNNGPLTMSNLASFRLESPLGLNTSDRRVMFGDMFLLPGDTNKPHSTRSNGGLSTLGTGGQFDFDEVVQDFPSPRTDTHLGSSPSRWDTSINSAGSLGSITREGEGAFFPESGYLQQRRSHSGSGLSATLHGQEAAGAASKQSFYDKKMKRAPRRDSSILSNMSELSNQQETDEQEAENR